MEQIKLFVDNIFKSLPENDEMKRLKEDMYLNMEEKYHELKKQGKPENEAIGIVITEFGNIDELLEEMNIKVEGKENKNPALDLPDIRDYISSQHNFSLLIAIGIALIMVGISIMLALIQIFEDNFPVTSESSGVAPVIILLLFVMSAVAIFIYAANSNKKYQYIDEGEFDISYSTKSILKEELDEISKKTNLYIIIGVCLCIFSPISILSMYFIDTSYIIYGASILFILVAVAVVLFIIASYKMSSYNKLLKLGEFSQNTREANKEISAIASVYWPIVTCIFFISGFIYGQWAINWVIFPIAGVLFGAISSFISVIKK